MRDIACEELIQSNDPSAIALSILCDFKGQDKQTVINTILRKLRELNDDHAFEKYLEMVTLFYQIGIEKGKLEERFDNAIVMIKDFQLAIDDVVKKLNIKKEELLEYMKQTKSK